MNTSASAAGSTEFERIVNGLTRGFMQVEMDEIVETQRPATLCKVDRSEANRRGGVTKRIAKQEREARYQAEMEANKIATINAIAAMKAFNERHKAKMNPGHAAFARLVEGVDAYVSHDLADRASRPKPREKKPAPVKVPLTPAELAERRRAGIAKRRLGVQPKPKKAKPEPKPKKAKLTPEDRGRAIAEGWARKRARAKAEREAAAQRQ